MGEPGPPAGLRRPERLELGDMDPFKLGRELGMSEVKKPELPRLIIGADVCALLLPDDDDGG
jgi:hypothetical protein